MSAQWCRKVLEYVPHTGDIKGLRFPFGIAVLTQEQLVTIWW